MKLFELRKIGDMIRLRALRQGESLPSDALRALSGLEELKGASGFSAIVCSERHILPSLCVLCGGSLSSLPPSVEWLDYPSPFQPSALPTDREELRKVVMGFPMADALHRSIVAKARSDPLPIVGLPAERLRGRLERVLRKEADLADPSDVGSLNLDLDFLSRLESIYMGSVEERSNFLKGLLAFAESGASAIGLETALKARMVVLEIYRVPSGGTTVRYVSPFDPRLNAWPGAEIRIATVASFHEREATRLGYHVAPLVLVLPGYSHLPMGGVPVVLWWHDQWVLKVDQDKSEGEGRRDKRKNRISRFVRSEIEIYQFLFEALGLEKGR
jgi:hypothetical protein